MGITDFQYKYQINPITLVGGTVTSVPGSAQSIIAFTETSDFPNQLGNSFDTATTLDNYFAHFIPLPGATLIDQEVGMYPFANQVVAANAVITQPRRVSMLMICPARGQGGYSLKRNTLSALVATLQYHNNSGGTYTIATPNYTYTNCIMLCMKDVSTSETKQPQVAWQLDFVQPLLTIEEVNKAQGNLMDKITRGTRINGDPTWSGAEGGVNRPSSLFGPSVFPSSKSSISASSMPSGSSGN